MLLSHKARKAWRLGLEIRRQNLLLQDNSTTCHLNTLYWYSCITLLLQSTSMGQEPPLLYLLDWIMERLSILPQILLLHTMAWVCWPLISPHEKQVKNQFQCGFFETCQGSWESSLDFALWFCISQIADLYSQWLSEAMDTFVHISLQLERLAFCSIDFHSFLEIPTVGLT